MADQAINALPIKTAPTTGDKMLMIGAAEEYQIDYDQLATAILNKLTSKTFTLDQGTKSLVAALNELNSKTEWKLAGKVTGKNELDISSIVPQANEFLLIVDFVYSSSGARGKINEIVNIDQLSCVTLSGYNYDEMFYASIACKVTKSVAVISEAWWAVHYPGSSIPLSDDTATLCVYYR